MPLTPDSHAASKSTGLHPAGKPRAHALDPRGEQGIAIVIALMAMLLLSALGAGLVLTTTSETLISGNYRDSSEALYAADAGIERVLPDLLTPGLEWTDVLTGAARSSFVDGAPSGERTTPFGGTLDLTKATNMLNCGLVTSCSVEAMNASSAERPWTTNNPRWRPYAHGPLSSLLDNGSIVSSMYVVVWVGDDPGDDDNDPLVDSNGQVTMRAEAFGPGGIHKVIEATVSRTEASASESGYLAQRGQDEQNARTRRAGVQAAGDALRRAGMSIAAGGLEPR